MKFSSENENFVRGGMFVFFFFSCVRARMNFFDPRALWEMGKNGPRRGIPCDTRGCGKNR